MSSPERTTDHQANAAPSSSASRPAPSPAQMLVSPPTIPRRIRQKPHRFSPSFAPRKPKKAKPIKTSQPARQSKFITPTRTSTTKPWASRNSSVTCDREPLIWKFGDSRAYQRIVVPGCLNGASMTTLSDSSPAMCVTPLSGGSKHEPMERIDPAKYTITSFVHRGQVFSESPSPLSSPAPSSRSPSISSSGGDTPAVILRSSSCDAKEEENSPKTDRDAHNNNNQNAGPQTKQLVEGALKPPPRVANTTMVHPSPSQRTPFGVIQHNLQSPSRQHPGMVMQTPGRVKPPAPQPPHQRSHQWRHRWPQPHSSNPAMRRMWNASSTPRPSTLLPFRSPPPIHRAFSPATPCGTTRQHDHAAAQNWHAASPSTQRPSPSAATTRIPSQPEAQPRFSPTPGKKVTPSPQSMRGWNEKRPVTPKEVEAFMQSLKGPRTTEPAPKPTAAQLGGGDDQQPSDHRRSGESPSSLMELDDEPDAALGPTAGDASATATVTAMDGSEDVSASSLMQEFTKATGTELENMRTSMPMGKLCDDLFFLESPAVSDSLIAGEFKSDAGAFSTDPHAPYRLPPVARANSESSSFHPFQSNTTI